MSCSSNVTSGFVDLATYDELEKYLYGGPHATAYFVRETRKSTWFTQVPVVLSRASGNPGFGTEWSVTISRAGDYLLSVWLRLTVSAVELTDALQVAGFGVRWTKNFMHNLIREVCLTFNDLVACRIDNYFLDFWSAFTVPASKAVGYNNMIGSYNELFSPKGNPAPASHTGLPSAVLNLPLPLFFTRDSGVALPTAALPYNDMRITLSFRDWTDLLIVEKTTAPAVGADNVRMATAADLKAVPTLTNVNVWGNYAIVSNDERKRMACAPRDILIEQVQTAPRQTFNPSRDANPSYDIRFSHAIKVLFFGARNTTRKNEWSNYTTASSVGHVNSVDFVTVGTYDPLATVSLVYENTQRLAAMGADYYSLVQPWYHAPSIPEVTGYHMYSYSLDFFCLDPMGSTNYGKLTNVSINPTASDAAILASTGGFTDAESGADFAQSWEFLTVAVSNNIIRISGGALGFPVL